MDVVPIIGFGFLGLIAAFFTANLVTSYRTQGGAIGQVPVMAAALYVPTVAAVVIAIIDRTAGWPGWSGSTYLVLWLAALPVAWQVTALAGRLGARGATPVAFSYETLLDRQVLDAVRPAVGRRLIGVRYDVLAADLSEFDVRAPNETGGCQSIVLVFEDLTVTLSWSENDGWRSLLGDAQSHFSITALSGGKPIGLSVDRIPPWDACVGQALGGFELLAAAGAPQAIRLIFPARSPVVATGYHGRNPAWIGDGDELLVFCENDWPARDWTVLHSSEREAQDGK